MIRALLMSTDATTQELAPAPGNLLQALQAGVGGIVDVVSLTPTLDMWVGDEGSFTEPVNLPATWVAMKALGRKTQNFHGPVVFTGGLDDEGNTMPLSGAAHDFLTDALTELAEAGL